MTLTTRPHRTAMPVALLAVATGLVGCVGDLPRSGRKDTGSGSGSGSAACVEVTTDTTIRSTADFDKLPKGCWDLFAKLTIQGSDITSLAKLGNLAGLDELDLIGTNLAALDTASKLKAYGPVTITGNTKLANLNNLEVERADNIPLGITVSDNPVLTSLGGLTTVPHIDLDLTITNNNALVTADFHALTGLDGAIRVTNNAALTSLDISRMTSTGRIEIADNLALTSVSGLAATTIQGDVTFRNNRALTMLGTMSALTSIAGNLTIDNNAALTNIGSFTSSMRFVAGTVTVTNNAAITDLGQVSHFTTIGALTITDNQNLNFCRAREVAACVRTSGSINIRNNKNGNNCNSWCGN